MSLWIHVVEATEMRQSCRISFHSERRPSSLLDRRLLQLQQASNILARGPVVQSSAGICLLGRTITTFRLNPLRPIGKLIGNIVEP